ncbi:MAG: hypothetical protein IPK74_08240 [Deltaproteobacteria bacterium]|nr:hypothetical protein [Deltaproteobacteria bacterium]
MTSPEPILWSTPKFLAIALVVEFVAVFVTNGLFNMVLGWNVPSYALGVVPSLLLVALLPRWRVFHDRLARRCGGSNDRAPR